MDPGELISQIFQLSINRWVPIEVGNDYRTTEWTQHIDRMDEFILNHMLSDRPEVHYLAQHNLLSQIPELRSFFICPDYVSLSEFDEPEINLWIGPVGSVTPLHYDRKHNLLCQVLGFKKITLFPPECGKFLSPLESLPNTSAVCLETWREDFPDFADALPHATHVLLRPGDTLFLPKTWWHRVESLSPSISISYWF